MCGIVGYAGDKPAAPIIIKGLNNLRYRGYDSFGLVTLTDKPHLYKSLKQIPVKPPKTLLESLPGQIAIGHTRWATAGTVSEANAHPIEYDGVYLVHNGIISNAKEIADHELDSVALAKILSTNKEWPLIKLHEVLYRELKGSWAFLTLIGGQLYGGANELPLLVSECGSYFASDVVGFPKDVKNYYRLPDKTTFFKGEKVWVFNEKGYQELNELSLIKRGKNFTPNKGRCKFFMLKEINEQATLPYNYNIKDKIDLDDYPGVTIFGCGSSYYAALFGQFLIEKLTLMPAKAIYSTLIEDSYIDQNNLFIGLSQSGETADTINAFRYIRKITDPTALVITNNEHSTLASESRYVSLLNTGPEIAVGATKTFTGQVFTLINLTCSYYNTYVDVFKKACKTLLDNNGIAKLAKELSHYPHMLLLAKGWEYPIALEGALKLKEVAYKHAEAVLSSEIKHGPLSLISDEVLSVFLMGDNEDKNEKVLENMSEISARKGKILTICQGKDIDLVKDYSKWIIELPDLEGFPSFSKGYDVISALVSNIALQLLAYYIAIEEGLPVDNPRFLAKTIAV